MSRSTLRRALQQMQRDATIRAEHGTGNRILAGTARRGRRSRSQDIALLVPVPLEQLRPTLTLWIDELRAMVSERGCRFHVLHGPQYFRVHPSAALKKVVRQHPHGCWILAMANPACQQWFVQRQIPCLVAGSCHSGVDLPFRDLDHRAMCRHAAAVMLALGHRQLVFVTQETRLAGDIDSEAGFLEGVNNSRHPDAMAVVCRHNATVEGITKVLKRLLAHPNPPTGMLVANAYHCLAVLTALAALGRRVPADISVISRDNDPFLSFVVPSPACYRLAPRAFAGSMLRPMLELLGDGTVTQRSLRLMPEFVRGTTVAAPPVAT